MEFNREIVRLWHQVDAEISKDATDRRLRECQEYRSWDKDRKYVIRSATIARKKPTKTESEILGEFPDHGIMLSARRDAPGLCSRALIFSPNIPTAKRAHAAIISLVRLGRLAIATGIAEYNGSRVNCEILVKLTGSDAE